MTYRFECRDTGHVLMLQPDGNTVLRLIGRDPWPQGVIETAASPVAIAAIERAIVQEGQRRGQAAAGVPDPYHFRSDADTPAKLSQRARPLLKLLRSAQAATREVSWGV